LSGGAPDPLGASTTTARVVDIAVLVFREGLEFILVLAALTANMANERRHFRRPIAAGAATAIAASLVTWLIAVRIIDSLSENVAALHIQALTGLLAIIVLVIVMNWFFHKVYWTGWISLHSRKKQDLLEQAEIDRLTISHRGASGGGWRFSDLRPCTARDSRSCCSCSPTD
jgi:high-affinity iron transporter